jgi:lysyl-tRNA synthetase class 2
MATLKELRNVRIEKLNKLRKLGIDPYPAQSQKDYPNAEIVDNFNDFNKKEVTLTGRLMSWRAHGSLVFADLQDFSGRIQLYIHQDDLEKTDKKKQLLGFDDLNLLDIGDFVQVTGKITKTKREEISIQPTQLKILVKALRPLPDKWEGLKDKELRFRRRYLDTTMDKEVRDRFVRRSLFWDAHREFFKERGFLEMNVPVLEQVPGGGDATPFITHMEAIDQDFYLRISQELYLKRLIGGGYEKVYEIGPRFRNEGLSDEHLPEHMAMEFYWAYADWEDGMEFIEELFNYVIEKVYGNAKEFEIRGHKVKFGKKWERIDFGKVMKKAYGIDVYKVTLKEVEKLLDEHGVKKDFALNLPRAVDNLWKLLRKDISGPAFLINHPKYLSPLQKASKDNPNMVERFQPIIAGSELGNGWSEVNDAIDQFERFSEQQELRDSGDTEAQWLDIDYVEMLEYGIPPTFGYGHSERVFWFLEDVPAREGVPFPQLKEHLDETTKEIYGLKDPVSKSTAKVEVSDDLSGLPSRKEAEKVLKENVKNDYQQLHSKMVATALEAYADKYGGDKDLWWVTGLLHDLDYDKHPDKHPIQSLEWFKEWKYPDQLTHAVAAHAWTKTNVMPATKLAAALIATDELAGFLHAYSLMRPNGWDGMKAKSVKKKFKDKSFAAKIDREEILFGIEKLEVDFNEHVDFLIDVYSKM